MQKHLYKGILKKHFYSEVSHMRGLIPSYVASYPASFFSAHEEKNKTRRPDQFYDV